MSTNNHPLLSIQHLKKYFQIHNKTLHAVEDISLEIYHGETLGLVGESGCGKSTVGRTILRLYEPTAGKVFFKDIDIFALKRRPLKHLRQQMQMIFQDPYASLNPRMTVQEIISEALDIHNLFPKASRKQHILEILQQVGLKPYHISRFPHEFSGGQRQRIGIARAIAVQPQFIVCDEPISALDVSIQAQIINLLKDLQTQLGLTYLFISHDLSMVKYLANRVAVMYLGKLMELADSSTIYSTPLHPYTQTLLSAIPTHDPILEKKRPPLTISTEIPSSFAKLQGCPFCTRCPHATPECTSTVPSWKEVSHQHFVACHRTQ